MDPFVLYLITRCSAINTAAGIIATLSALAGSLLVVFCIAEKHDNPDGSVLLKSLKCWRNTLLTAFCISLPIYLAMPTTQEAAAIYVLPQLANSKIVQEESAELYTLAKEYLKSLTVKDKK